MEGVYGTVMTINRGNPAEQEVLVDSWPKFKVVLTRLHRKVASGDSDFYTNTYTVYYRDLGAYRTLLGSADAVNWGQTFRIHGNIGPTASGRAPQQLNTYVVSGPNPRIPPYSASPEALHCPSPRLQGCSHEPYAGQGSRMECTKSLRTSPRLLGIKLEVFRYFTYFHPDPSSIPEIRVLGV
ncbi:unnamed protein product [Eretmochelys imbricata]